MAKKKQKPTSLLITALVILGIIQCVAMHYGIDGIFRATIAAIIAGIVGLSWPSPFQK